jgi:hypothetical protein
MNGEVGYASLSVSRYNHREDAPNRNEVCSGTRLMGITQHSEERACGGAVPSAEFRR